MVDRTDKDAHTVDLTNIGENETTTDKDEKIESVGLNEEKKTEYNKTKEIINQSKTDELSDLLSKMDSLMNELRTDKTDSGTDETKSENESDNEKQASGKEDSEHKVIGETNTEGEDVEEITLTETEPNMVIITESSQDESGIDKEKDESGERKVTLQELAEQLESTREVARESDIALTDEGLPEKELTTDEKESEETVKVLTDSQETNIQESVNENTLEDGLSKDILVGLMEQETNDIEETQEDDDSQPNEDSQPDEEISEVIQSPTEKETVQPAPVKKAKRPMIAKERKRDIKIRKFLRGVNGVLVVANLVLIGGKFYNDWQRTTIDNNQTALSMEYQTIVKGMSAEVKGKRDEINAVKDKIDEMSTMNSRGYDNAVAEKREEWLEQESLLIETQEMHAALAEEYSIPTLETEQQATETENIEEVVEQESDNGLESERVNEIEDEGVTP